MNLFIFLSLLFLPNIFPHEIPSIIDQSPQSKIPRLLFDDYSLTVNCYRGNYANSEEEETALNEINLRWIDSLVFIILGPISFFSTLFIIITFIKYPKMREQPGDILLGISVSEFVLTIHWMVSAGYFVTYPNDPPESDGKFCLTNAVFSMLAGTFEFLYNCFFCIYLILKIRNVLKGGHLPKKTFHIIVWVINIAIIIGLGASGSLGKNLFGTCSIKAISVLPVMGPLIFMIYVILSGSAIAYFKKKVPNDERLQKYREEFLNYYYKYVRACCIIWSVIAFCNIVTMANCLTKGGGISGINIFLTIGNIFKLLTPIALSLIRYQDPFLKSRVGNFLRRMRSRMHKKSLNEQFLEKKQSKKKTMNNKDVVEPENEKDFSINQNEIDEQENQFEPNSLDSSIEGDVWINVVQNDIKVMFTYTMLSGIILNYNNLKDQLMMSQNTDHQDFDKKIHYHLNHEKLKSFLPEVADQIMEKNYKTFNATMYSHAPECFEDLIQQDRDMIDLNVSLDLSKNYEQIQKATGGADGGRGGEFFFFSYDNRVILKTLTNQDFTIIKSILKDYYRYLKMNPDSYIAKIYGIYSFIQKDINTSINIILMRNIAACPKQFILRTYDLKGSTFDREVLKKKPSADLSKVTLKDVDFDNIEKRLIVENEIEKKIHEILENDSRFFMDRGLIDYSLIIFKIDKKGYFEELENKGINTKDFFLNKRELYSIPALKEEGVYYHIGIIDYLQPYDLQKFFEKTAKKIINFDIKLDTSSQDPLTYQKRFVEYIKKII